MGSNRLAIVAMLKNTEFFFVFVLVSFQPLNYSFQHLIFHTYFCMLSCSYQFHAYVLKQTVELDYEDNPCCLDC